MTVISYVPIDQAVKLTADCISVSLINQPIFTQEGM
jgi:hypothetical protein